MSKKSFLNTLSNKTLDRKLSELIGGERELLTEIILHIREVSLRKMYLDYGYASLFEYLTQRMGYANGSAQRRIDAARLSGDVPELINHIESGQINLSQISLMAQAMRQLPADSKVDLETKEQMIAKLCDKSVAESETLVSKALNIPVKEITKTKHQKDESVRLEITFTKSQWEKLTKARELLSYSLPDGGWDQVIECMSDKILKKAEGRTAMPLKPEILELLPDGSKGQDRRLRTHVPLPIKRQIFSRDKCCQYQSKLTNQICGSRWKLTIDHIQPVWAGGLNDIENLRILCAAHNSKVYRDQAGIRSK